MYFAKLKENQTICSCIFVDREVSISVSLDGKTAFAGGLTGNFNLGQCKKWKPGLVESFMEETGTSAVLV